MARIAGINIPVNKHVVDRADAHLRHRPQPRADDLQSRGRRADDRGERPHRGRGRAAARRDREVPGRRRPAPRDRMNIKRLMDLGCYRGIRHRRGLPLRGQRTRTNARTRKGPRRPSGSRAEESACAATATEHSRAAQSPKESQAADSRRRRARARVVQQHDHQHHRSAGQHARVGDGRQLRLQGLAQEHAVRGAGRGRARGHCGARTTA